MSIVDEFQRKFDEAQRAVHEMFAGVFGAEDYDEIPERGPAPRGFNPRVIVARIELKTESPDEAEAIGLEIAELIRQSRRDGRIDYAYQGWAFTTKKAME